MLHNEIDPEPHFSCIKPSNQKLASITIIPLMIHGKFFGSVAGKKVTHDHLCLALAITTAFTGKFHNEGSPKIS